MATYVRISSSRSIRSPRVFQPYVKAHVRVVSEDTIERTVHALIKYSSCNFSISSPFLLCGLLVIEKLSLRSVCGYF